jgi:tetratricopeptide (TPR) repeat protein
MRQNKLYGKNNNFLITYTNLIYVQKSVEENPQSAESHLHLGHMLEKEGHFADSKHHYTEAALWASNNSVRATALTFLALDEIRQSLSSDSYRKCLRMLKTARAVDSSNQFALLHLGYVYSDLREHEHALESYLSLITINPQHILGNLNIGNYYFHRGNFSGAVDWYRHTLRAAVGSPEAELMAYNNMGAAFRQMGGLDNALWAYREAFSRTQTSRAIRSLSRSARPQEGGLASVPVSAYDAWTISNLLTMMGLMCNWQHLELLEKVMLHVVTGLKRSPLAQDAGTKLDATEVDSYGFMLNR